MKAFFIILSLAAVATADLAPGLRVRWSTVTNASYFIDIPREVGGTIDKGWTIAKQPGATLFPTLTLYCPTNGPYVCALYDDAGFIAGLQIALPKDQVPDTADDMRKHGYFDWINNNVNYYAVQQYYVTKEYLAKSVIDRQISYDTSKTLQEDAVWFPLKNTGKLIKIPTAADRLTKLGFLENSCVQTQGTHFVYDYGENCDDTIPFFLLENNGIVVGTGWNHFINLVDDFDWFEQLVRDFFVRGLPNFRSCVVDKFDRSGGVMSMHIFYVDEPQKIACSADDFIYPPAE